MGSSSLFPSLRLMDREDGLRAYSVLLARDLTMSRPCRRIGLGISWASAAFQNHRSKRRLLTTHAIVNINPIKSGLFEAHHE